MTFDILTKANSLNKVIEVSNNALSILDTHYTASDIYELGGYIYKLREYPQIKDAIISILKEATEEFNKL